MAIRPTDARTLWARSGNRCAICNVELTPEGSLSTLGQMCHIIGQSVDGPRGHDEINEVNRDSYANLILLCRNDHGIIDTEIDQWPAERLQETKLKHEQWVADRLSDSSISISPISNDDFIEKRKEYWRALDSKRPVICMSITPLRISEDVVDPTNETVVNALNNAEVTVYGDSRKISANKTRISMSGIRNDSILDSSFARRHYIEIQRSGHCEYVVVLSDDQSVIPKEDNPPRKIADARAVLRYSSVAECVSAGLDWLERARSSVLPANDVLLTFVVENIFKTNLYSYQYGFNRYVFGHTLVDGNEIVRSRVMTPDENIASIKHDLLTRLAHSYGLYLPKLLDEKGEFYRPITQPTE